VPKKEEQTHFSEKAINIVENIAFRLAEASKGRISPNSLVPFLPMSLALIRECLNNMVDHLSVFREIQENTNIPIYVFVAYENSEKADFKDFDSCAACDKENVLASQNILCLECDKLLRGELNNLADKIGWPADAVYEHEILYLSASRPEPLYCGKLAGRSSFTVRSMRRKLDRLCLDGAAEQAIDNEKGLLEYRFPAIEYTKEHYRRNMSVIKTYPASIMEEIEIKLVKIILCISVLAVCLFMASFFFRLPFPAMIFLLLVLSPMLGLMIWKKRSKAIVY